jgi:hypothetical protein
MLSGDLTDLSQDFAGFFGDVKRVCAPVICAALAHDEAKRRHLVDDRYETTGVHSEFGGECALAETRGVAKQTEYSSLSRVEVQRGKGLGKALGGVCSDLR